MSRYTSKHTGPVIDAAIDRAKAGGAIDTLLQNNNPRNWGIGSVVTSIGNNADLNDYHTATGFWGNTSTDTILTWKNKPENWASNEAMLAVYVISTSYVIQELYECQNRIAARRVLRGTMWSPWEYLNPVMTLGKEYRTTERYNGKAVYTQARSVPSGPVINGITIVTFSGSEGVTEFVDYGGSLTDGSYICAIPGVDGGGNALLNAGPICSSSSSALQIYMKNVGSFDLTSYSGTCWVKYTKD